MEIKVRDHDNGMVYIHPNIDRLVTDDEGVYHKLYLKDEENPISVVGHLIGIRWGDGTALGDWEDV